MIRAITLPGPSDAPYITSMKMLSAGLAVSLCLAVGCAVEADPCHDLVVDASAAAVAE